MARLLATLVVAALLDVHATDSSYRVTIRGDVQGAARRCTIAGHSRDIGDSARFTVDCVPMPASVPTAPVP